MKLYKLKNTLIFICYFIFVLYLGMQSVIASSDLEEQRSHEIRNSSLGFTDDFEDHITSGKFNTFQDNLKDIEDSYLSYSVKCLIKNTYQIINFIKKHPKKAVLIGLFIGYGLILAYQLIILEPLEQAGLKDENCFCYYVSTNTTLRNGIKVNQLKFMNGMFKNEVENCELTCFNNKGQWYRKVE